MDNSIPVIDVFAGPGGLGEGFSALNRESGNPYYKIRLSVEKDIYAFKTLELRSFFRQFPYKNVPEDYYSFMRGEITKEELFNKYKTQYEDVKKESWLAELGTGRDFDNELDRRIREIIGENDKWVLIGGPPCQAYSVMGRAREKKEEDERNYLYIEYLRIIAMHKPAVFVMENVKGILSSKINGQFIFNQILKDLETPQSVFRSYSELNSNTKSNKYKIFSLVNKVGNSKENLNPSDFIVECEKFGIPQARHRVILLGIREDLNGIMPDTLTKGSEFSVKDVIFDLPKLRSGISKEKDSPSTWKVKIRDSIDRRWIKSSRSKWGNALGDRLEQISKNIKSPQHGRGGEFIPCNVNVCEGLKWWYLDEKIGGITNHFTKSHMEKDIYRYMYASCFTEIFKRSPLLNEFPPDLLPNHKNAKSGNFNDRFRVQLYGSPSTTITSHLSKDGHYYIHPDPWQCRSLTVREAARLQTFPDNYFFCGSRTQQYTQVGNAVPPLLALKIAEIVKKILIRVT